MATSANITYRKLYTIGKSKLCWFQMRVNGVGWLSGREDMSKTKLALNPRLRLEVFRITVKRPSKVGQRKVRSLVRNRNTQIVFNFLNIFLDLIPFKIYHVIFKRVHNMYDKIDIRPERCQNL